MRQSAKEMNVQLCDRFQLDKEIQVNYTEKGKQVMILDLGAPVGLAGKSWLTNYCKYMKIQLNDLDSAACFKQFKFGDQITTSRSLVKIPVVAEDLEGNEN